MIHQPAIIALLTLAGFAAGLVDSIAGGGGIITLPALLVAGLDPRIALGTNKGQAIFGATASVVAYARHGEVDRRRAPWSFAASAAGALLGAKCVLLSRPEGLRPVVLSLLCVAAITVFIRKPEVAKAHDGKDNRRESIPLALAIALAIGFYDGFFGPGTGTFLILAYAIAFGDRLVRASGNAKVANFASNLAAFALFAAAGAIDWKLALPMGLAQTVGATVGARLAVRRGAKLVRAAAVVVCLLLAARVAWQMLG